MADIIIDAQIIKGYFEESIGKRSQLTTDVTPLINQLAKNDHVYLDSDGQIEHEWKQVVEPEWFTAWLGQLLIDDIIRIVPLISNDDCYILKQELGKLGFPIKGREAKDFWYIRTAKSVVCVTYTNRTVFLITEDIHFYEPKLKNKVKGEDRRQILLGHNGVIQKFLIKRENISILCIDTYFNAIDK